MTVERTNIDFDTALTRGKDTYTGEVGDWWLNQCADAAHQRAYRTIAMRLRGQFPRREPKTIIEYACGPGLLLARLARTFPKSRLIGIDGSSQMLDAASARLRRMGRSVAERVELVETHLPNFNLPKWEADAIVFAFPNICPHPDDQPYYDRHGSRHRLDRPVAKLLGEAREEDPEMETVFDDPETVMTQLLDCKVVSRNLRGLVRRGGICVRVTYANASREYLSDLVNLRLDFEAGCMETEFRGRRPEAIFRHVDTTYHRSRVILDVYHQTGDEDNLRGGFLVSVLRAI